MVPLCLFDYSETNRQTQSNTMTSIFGRKEGVKDFFQIFLWNAMTSVRKFHFDAMINRVEFSSQIQFSIAIHRICRIDDND